MENVVTGVRLGHHSDQCHFPIQIGAPKPLQLELTYAHGDQHLVHPLLPRVKENGSAHRDQQISILLKPTRRLA